MKYEKMRELVPEQKKTRPNNRTNITDYGDFSVCTNEKGLVFIVDSDIAKSIQHRSWCNSQGYVASRVGGELIRLHDYVMSTIAAEKPEGCYVDHINQDKRDNRRRNLRFVSPTENSKNVPLRKDNTSGYVGVAKTEDGKRYRAYITVDGKQKSLGRYDTAEEAHQARMEAEERLGFLTRPRSWENTIEKRIERRRREQRTCGTCRYHEFEPIDRGYVCVNGDSEECTEWTEDDDSCEHWEEKPSKETMRICATCRWHVCPSYKDAICNNPNSNCEAKRTLYTWSCPQWEQEEEE